MLIMVVAFRFSLAMTLDLPNHVWLPHQPRLHTQCFLEAIWEGGKGLLITTLHPQIRYLRTQNLDFKVIPASKILRVSLSSE